MAMQNAIGNKMARSVRDTFFAFLLLLPHEDFAAVTRKLTEVRRCA